MYGSKFRFIFVKYKSKNRNLSFQIEKKMLLKIDFSCDSFPKLPSHKTHEYFSFIFLNAFFTVVINYGHCNSLCFRFSICGEGTLEGAIYNITTWNPRWRLATDFLRGAGADFLKLACLNAHHCHRFRVIPLQKFTRSSGRVWWRILVANLATNFQDLVANAENLGALAPVLGAISGPVSLGVKMILLDNQAEFCHGASLHFILSSV